MPTALLRGRQRALYAAFDRFPSSKGAATHIARMCGRLFDRFDGGALLCLGADDLPRYQVEGDVEVLRCVSRGDLFGRAEAFARLCHRETRAQAESLELAHFRDPFSGVAILGALRDAGSHCATVYEVNGLPSIEWPERYPDLGRRTRIKLREREAWCLQRADAIVTPSHTIADNLARLGVPRQRIDVVPNGADPTGPGLPARPIAAPYFLYFGALQPWQGLTVLLRAFARLADHADWQLVICASTPAVTSDSLRDLAARLGVAARLVWQHELDRAALAPWVRHAHASIAPLTACARNLEQGCSPLKIIESMAAGVPVVASDLPAVREILSHDRDGVLVAPDRPGELARALRLLIDYPARRDQLGLAARRRFDEAFTWDGVLRRLDSVYDRLGVRVPDRRAGVPQAATCL